MQAKLVGDEIVNMEEQCEWFLSVERQAEIARTVIQARVGGCFNTHHDSVRHCGRD